MAGFDTGQIAPIASAGCQKARITAQRFQRDNPGEPKAPQCCYGGWNINILANTTVKQKCEHKRHI